jgi:hypothetical protein
MPNLNFDMATLSSHGYKECHFEREEDFSVLLISFNKDQIPVTISPNKWTKHPHLESLDKFYQIFSDSKGEELVELLSREEGAEALSILEKLPLVKKVAERIVKISFKDHNEILDNSSPYKLTYQLKIINEQKGVKHTLSMIEKGFIDHITRICLNKKMHTAEGYTALTLLMVYFNEMLKFFKMAKNTQIFNEKFLI